MSRPTPTIVDRAVGRALSAIRLARTESGRECYRKGYADLRKAQEYARSGPLKNSDPDLHMIRLRTMLNMAAWWFECGREVESTSRRAA